MTTTADDSTNQATSGTRHIVADHYEIDVSRPLGSGGMSMVYRGLDLRTRRKVALKTLRPEYRHDASSRTRFRREIRTMAFIQHPNVATVYDYWEDDIAPWAVLELVTGESLHARMDEDGPLPLDLIAHYLNQIADALGNLHERGLVHLDVKPQNLMVMRDQSIKLIDFGLAQPTNSPQQLIGGTAFGTATYLSPEQASGDAVTAGSDVYAVGCVLYEMLTGEPPFGTASPESGPNPIIQAHLTRTPYPPSQRTVDRNLPGWVDELVLWSLDKQPATRIADIRLLAELFQFGVDGELSRQRTQAIRQGYLAPIDTVVESPPQKVESRPSTPRQAVAPARSNPAHRRKASLKRIVIGLLALTPLALIAWFLVTGAVPMLVDPVRTYSVGNGATVIVQDLNFRDGPGLSTTTLAQLSVETAVTIVGSESTIDGEPWIPISIVGQDPELTGYVWKPGIEPDPTSGWTWIKEKLN